MKRFIGCLLAIQLISGCSESDGVVETQTDYLPLKAGFYQVYDVSEIHYSAFAPPESLSYELKHEIIDSFINGEGNTTFVIHRSTRQQSSDPWTYQETWSAYSKSQYTVVNEGNTSFIKLQYPLYKGSSWDGNLLNTIGEDLYSVDDKDQNYTLSSGESYDKCIRINQSDEQSLVFQDTRTEIYSLNVGLIFKESTIVEFDTSNGTLGGEIVGGFYWKQELKEYGQN